MTYSFSDTHWPVIELVFEGRATESEGVASVRDVDRTVARGQPYIVVCDASDALMPEPSFIRVHTQWMRAHIAQVRELNRGTALVLPSAFTRGIARGLLHVTQFPVPYDIFETLAAARDWAGARAQGLAQKPDLARDPQ